MAIGVLEKGESALDALNAALDALGSDYLPGLGHEELGARCVGLQTARQRLDAVIALGIAEADRAGTAVHAKQRTMAQYLASRTHASPDALRADMRVGTWVGQFTQFEQAMLDGKLSRQHVNLLRRTVNIRVFTAMQRDQTMFIEFARDYEWKSFQATIKYWLMVNDQDGPEPEDHEAGNTCTITQLADGRVRISLNLDPVTGAILVEQVGNESNQLFDKDNENGTIRTPTQRRAAALRNLVERGAGRSEGKSKPLIHVVMSLKVLQNALAQLAKAPEDQDFTSVLDPDDPDGRCELMDGTPIHPKYALILMMNARIRRQVLTAKSKTLNASEEVRLFPDWMKYIRLVETRGQCEVAGCDAPLDWLRADHHRPFSETQQTSLEDLRTICDPDNKAKGAGPPLAERRPPTSEDDRSGTTPS